MTVRSRRPRPPGAEGLDVQPEPRDDIKKFISNVNGLADQARILQSERKSILQERVPASMGPNLLTLSKDDDVSYEKLCQHVADAAYTRQRAFQVGGLRAPSQHRTTGSTCDNCDIGRSGRLAVPSHHGRKGRSPRRPSCPPKVFQPPTDSQEGSSRQRDVPVRSPGS
ncbi:hypothetical protein E4U38_002938 [Claviceps purpurea]|nr:hypothetical protein E4U38_002938 [Claviceps purpurea]